MKIITVKGKSFLVAVLAIAFIVSVSMLISVSFTSAVTLNGLTVVVDAGHGGIDGGVVGTYSGVSESEVNLAIATSLEFYLKERGYNVVMTRDSDDGLYGSATSNLKLADMQARRDIINEAAPDLVVSIHQNSYSRREVCGAQVFYATGSENSMTIAGKMKGVLEGMLPNADREIKEADYYILTCTQYPAVLVECGFMSNPEEEQLLITPEYQDKVAYALATGVTLSLEGYDNDSMVE